MTDAPVYHGVAKCRWCQQRFVQIHGWQWRCETEECFQKCAAEAILVREPVEGKSPYYYLPLPLQVDAENSKVKRLLVWGSAGISKSYGARMALYKRCQKFAGYQSLLLRCTLDQLRKNHLQFMGNEAKALGECKFVGSYPMHMAFENGSKMYAGYCDDLSDIGQHLGPEWDEVLIEEAGLLRSAALEEIPARDRGSSVAREAMATIAKVNTGRTRMFANPGGRGWLFLRDHYIDRTPDVELYPQYKPEFYGDIVGDVEDNPYLAENYREATLGGLNAERYAQLAHGRADVFVGQFFTTFHETTHVQRVAR